MLDRPAAWVGATAQQIARAVRRGDTSATAVVADHLDQIRSLRPRRRRVPGGARRRGDHRGGDGRRAARAVEPAAGRGADRGQGEHAGRRPADLDGSAAARQPVATSDHEVVRRLRGAGAIVVGTSRMPELGLWALTDDGRTSGRCRGRSPHRRESPATRGAPTVRRAARPAGRPPRSPPGWCRSRTATTGSARCASRPPAAAWSGSSRAGRGAGRRGRAAGTAWSRTASWPPPWATPRSASP